MNEKPDTPLHKPQGKTHKQDTREARLAENLRANLRRRKAASRKTQS